MYFPATAQTCMCSLCQASGLASMHLALLDSCLSRVPPSSRLWWQRTPPTSSRALLARASMRSRSLASQNWMVMWGFHRECWHAMVSLVFFSFSFLFIEKGQSSGCYICEYKSGDNETNNNILTSWSNSQKVKNAFDGSKMVHGQQHRVIIPFHSCQ